MSQGQSKSFTYRQSYLFNIEFIIYFCLYYFYIFSFSLQEMFRQSMKLFLHIHVYVHTVQRATLFWTQRQNFSTYCTCMRKNKQVYITKIL